MYNKDMYLHDESFSPHVESLMFLASSQGVADGCPCDEFARGALVRVGPGWA